MKVTVTATQEEKLQVVSDCLANTWLFAGRILDLSYDSAVYQKFKTTLGDDCTHEDVLMDMIKAGFGIRVDDLEGDDNVGELSLAKIEANWDSIRSEDLLDIIKENDDADTADNILQCLTLGDIVYG